MVTDTDKYLGKSPLLANNSVVLYVEDTYK